MVLSDKLNDGPSDGLFYNDFGSVNITVRRSRQSGVAWFFRIFWYKGMASGLHN